MDGSTMYPLVPYESFEEYRTLLRGIAEEFGDMVERYIRDDAGAHELTQTGVREINLCKRLDWGEALYERFRRLTKGAGQEFCFILAQVVVYSVHVASKMYCHLFRAAYTNERRRVKLARTMKTVAVDVVLDEDDDLGLMAEFRCHNFDLVHSKSDGPGWDFDDTAMVPVVWVQDAKLAFVMGTHRRLGGNALRGLGEDMIRLILSDRCF